MKSGWAKLLCRLLMVLMVWTPVQFAQAGMIGTDQIVTAASQADRTTVLEFVGRADVADAAAIAGPGRQERNDRVAAMTTRKCSCWRARSTACRPARTSTG